MHGVGRQVEQHRLELAFVDVHVRAARVERDLEPNALTEQLAQDRLAACEAIIEVEQLGP
jgi:hypothetical protein